ncbi:MAG: HAMP domain-containing protein [Beijerinckiaceae bacterium]|nr:MAG: HAMP domain-containing protein [Beijerinckiaceae bacterium]
MCFVRKSRILRSTVFRLAATYVVLFAISVLALGFVAYFAISMTLIHTVDAHIEDARTALQDDYRSGGLSRLLVQVNARLKDHRSNALLYLVLDPNGMTLAGQLPIIPKRSGWSYSDYIEKETDNDVGSLRILLTPLAGGVRLAVGADLEQVEDAKDAVANSLLSAFFAVVLFGTFGGIALSLALLRRVDTIRLAAGAISEGDLSKRVPLRGNDDDLDRLSRTLNHMLDRIAGLMESVRQVSADIAHDLKTPLARLRQRLEAAERTSRSAEDYNTAIDTAVGNVDEILATFSALLRIAQIEARTRRAGFRDVDLSNIVTTVVEAFVPAAEDAGQSLATDISDDVHVFGDSELLTQMIANLVENAIRHTPAGTRIAVKLRSDESGVEASIIDNGLGVPESERLRLFQKFYRLEHSRSTPGSGLGLSLVKAIADLHDIAIEVQNRKPGLAIVLAFASGPVRLPG